MTDNNRARSEADDQIGRRTVLKGTTAVGLAGIGATGVATAADASQSDELPHRVTIEPGSGGERVAYHFRVSGTVEPGPEAGTLGVDTIDGNVVQGEVGGSIEGNDDPVDDYLFSGAIAFADADGPLTVTLDVNGELDNGGSDDASDDNDDASDDDTSDDNDDDADSGNVVFGDDDDDDDDDDN